MTWKKVRRQKFTWFCPGRLLLFWTVLQHIRQYLKVHYQRFTEFFLGTLTYGIHNLMPKCVFFEIFKPFKWGQQQCACCNCIYTKSLLIFLEQNTHWKIWKKISIVQNGPFRWLFLEKYVQKYLFICIPLCFEMRSYQILIIFVNKIPGQNQSNFWHLTIFHVILKRNGL